MLMRFVYIAINTGCSTHRKKMSEHKNSICLQLEEKRLSFLIFTCQGFHAYWQ